MSVLNQDEKKPLTLSNQKSVDKIQALATKVQERCGKYDGKIEKDPFAGKKGLGFFELTFRYATMSDKIILAFTCLAIAIYGAAQPAFSVLFGASSTNVNN